MKNSLVNERSCKYNQTTNRIVCSHHRPRTSLYTVSRGAAPAGDLTTAAVRVVVRAATHSPPRVPAAHAGRRPPLSAVRGRMPPPLVLPVPKPPAPAHPATPLPPSDWRRRLPMTPAPSLPAPAAPVAVLAAAQDGCGVLEPPALGVSAAYEGESLRRSASSRGATYSASCSSSARSALLSSRRFILSPPPQPQPPECSSTQPPRIQTKKSILQ